MSYNLPNNWDNWHTSESDNLPQEVEIGASSVYLRKDVIQTENGYSYKELIISRSQWEAYILSTKPITAPLRADIDFSLALLGADDEVIVNELFKAELLGLYPNKEYSERVKKYKYYYESGQWSFERINLLKERGLITEEEYLYIVGENN